ncbi:MAG: WYL domain-containing protein, partial [Proteobacteria bacterium]|nr:WYL domain-containing protein [Pseudomonadota bacterium]
TPLSPSLEESDYARLQQQFRSFSEHLWGVSKSNAPQTVHVEMEILDNCPDSPVLTRLENEKRCGTVERISPNSARFSVDVYDGRELFPWLSTFIGNIMRMSFSDPSLTAAWEQRMNDMNDIYNI